MSEPVYTVPEHSLTDSQKLSIILSTQEQTMATAVEIAAQVDALAVDVANQIRQTSEARANLEQQIAQVLQLAEAGAAKDAEISALRDAITQLQAQLAEAFAPLEGVSLRLTQMSDELRADDEEPVEPEPVEEPTDPEPVDEQPVEPETPAEPAEGEPEPVTEPEQPIDEQPEEPIIL